MSTREQRGYQMFPVLNVARLETALRFASGPERHSAPGEILYDHGQQGVPSWLVLSGSVDIIRHRNWGRSSGEYRCLPIDTEGYDGLPALPIVSVAPSTMPSPLSIGLSEYRRNRERAFGIRVSFRDLAPTTGQLGPLI